MLLHNLEAGLFLNGYIAVRVKHVRQLERLGTDPVMMEGLRHFGEVPQPVEGIDLSSTKGLITTAAVVAPLVTIHVEKRRPDVCYVGKPEEIRRGTLHLKEIDPSADWEKKPTRWRLSDITRVDFGGRYETALALAGGSPVGEKATRSDEVLMRISTTSPSQSVRRSSPQSRRKLRR